MTLTGLARQTGLSSSHLSNVESGREGISPPALAVVAQALGTTIADLRQDDGTP